ncbi:hypothetical protein JAAARDRAFT_207914 [Jaapia argillacea MUCL 33604]|uniref:F-box domain-containing protein n=1 Tax=Jaapia argillacea MUCL 33604 TaxID=933084 RepID=A0A067PQ00_9AGAM|nr:hypothetical protein JAAARDRAFT_207914 [Jaapia argillacea MUCL 33604]
MESLGYLSLALPKINPNEKEALQRNRVEFLDLNLDVLSSILSFLTTSDLRRLASTSQACYELAIVEMISSVTLRNRQQTQGFCQFMLGGVYHRIPLMKSLTICAGALDSPPHSFYEKVDRRLGGFLADILEQANNLSSINIELIEFALTSNPRMSHAIASRCPHLGELIISHPMTLAVEMLTGMNGLRRLTLSEVGVTSDVATFVQPVQDTLEILHIRNRSNFRFGGTLCQCPSVHTITIDSSSHYLKQHLERAFPNLRRLHMSGVSLSVSEKFRKENLEQSDRREAWSELEIVTGCAARICTMALNCRVRRLEMMDEYSPRGLPLFPTDHIAFVDTIRKTSPLVLSFSLGVSTLSPPLFSRIAEVAASLRFLHVLFIDRESCRSTLNCLNQISDTFMSTPLTYLSFSVRTPPECFININHIETSLRRDWIPVLVESIPSLKYVELEVYEKHSWWEVHEPSGKRKVKKLEMERGRMIRKRELER